MRGENLTTFGQPVAWDNEYQHATRFQPPIGVAQERLLRAATVSWPQCVIVWRVEIAEPEALDRALHSRRISLDDVGNSLPGLLGAVGVKLDTVTKNFSAAGDNLECRAIANTRVERRRRSTWELEESANPVS